MSWIAPPASVSRTSMTSLAIVTTRASRGPIAAAAKAASEGEVGAAGTTGWPWVIGALAPLTTSGAGGGGGVNLGASSSQANPATNRRTPIVVFFLSKRKRSLDRARDGPAHRDRVCSAGAPGRAAQDAADG